MSNDLSGKAVLVTGGTKGIGLGTGLAFGRRGAICTLTNKWGSADEEEILRKFAASGAPEPKIVQADAASAEDTTALLEDLKSRHDHVEAFISNVSFAQIVKGLEDYTKRSLLRSIEYSVWPTVEYTQKIREVFGCYPRYVVGLSSIGPDKFTANYDFVAASKAVLETLCGYLTYRLAAEDVRVNILRASLVRTESLVATMGEECIPFIERFDPSMFVTVEEVAETIVALCSGLMDAVRGQVLSVDRGARFYDNIMRLYENRDKLHIPSKEKQA
jgi:NAD(P)-dependent dehydrogenase (short-subunit alcohol dehydrogenase family)